MKTVLLWCFLLLPLAVQAGGQISHAHGTFVGLEEGDYIYFKLRTAGKVTSYMMNPDSKSVAQVLDDPKRFVGKKCRVKLETSREYIEEAGETMEITTLVGVEWL